MKRVKLRWRPRGKAWKSTEISFGDKSDAQIYNYETREWEPIPDKYRHHFERGTTA